MLTAFLLLLQSHSILARQWPHSLGSLFSSFLPHVNRKFTCLQCLVQEECIKDIKISWVGVFLLVLLWLFVALCRFCPRTTFPHLLAPLDLFFTQILQKGDYILSVRGLFFITSFRWWITKGPGISNAAAIIGVFICLLCFLFLPSVVCVTIFCFCDKLMETLYIFRSHSTSILARLDTPRWGVAHRTETSPCWRVVHPQSRFNPSLMASCPMITLMFNQSKRVLPPHWWHPLIWPHFFHLVVVVYVVYSRSCQLASPAWPSKVLFDTRPQGWPQLHRPWVFWRGETSTNTNHQQFGMLLRGLAKKLGPVPF